MRCTMLLRQITVALVGLIVLYDSHTVAAARTTLATAVIDDTPTSARGMAVSRTLGAAKPHISAVLFMRSSDASAAALAGAWHSTGVLPDTVLHIAPSAGSSDSKVHTGVLYSNRLAVVKSGSWQCPVDHNLRHVWVKFKGVGDGAPGLTFVSVALSRAPSTAVRQAQALLQLLHSELGVDRVEDASEYVVVAGALNDRTSFGEVMELFQDDGMGGEIMPPLDKQQNANTNGARTERNHFIVANRLLDDVETGVVAPDGTRFDYGLVFNPSQYSTNESPHTRVEDATLLRAFPVLRGFEVPLQRLTRREVEQLGAPPVEEYSRHIEL